MISKEWGSGRLQCAYYRRVIDIILLYTAILITSAENLPIPIGCLAGEVNHWAMPPLIHPRRTALDCCTYNQYGRLDRRPTLRRYMCSKNSAGETLRVHCVVTVNRHRYLADSVKVHTLQAKYAWTTEMGHNWTSFTTYEFPVAARTQQMQP